MRPLQSLSVSEQTDEAARLLMRKDQKDLVVLSERANEPEISYEDLLNELKLCKSMDSQLDF